MRVVHQSVPPVAPFATALSALEAARQFELSATPAGVVHQFEIRVRHNNERAVIGFDVRLMCSEGFGKGYLAVAEGEKPVIGISGGMENAVPFPNEVEVQVAVMEWKADHKEDTYSVRRIEGTSNYYVLASPPEGASVWLSRGSR